MKKNYNFSKFCFNRAKRTLFVSTFFLFCGFCFAQQNETKIITLDDAVSLALENNISIKRNQISLKTLERKNKYSWNSVSPSINASVNYNQPLGENIDKNSVSASGSVSIRLSPSVYTSIQSAKLNYEMGKISYEQAVKSVELEVRNAFYQMLYAKENLSLLERNLETAKQRYNLNLEKYQKGQLSELDLLSAQYSYESLIPNIEASQITMENDMSTFKQLLGLNQTESIELSGSLDDFLSSFDFTLSFDINEIPSMKNLNYQIESAKNQLLATRFSAYGPSLSFGFSAGKDLKNTDSDFTFSLSAGVSVPLDGFLPWSSGALSITNQKATLEDLELQLENQKTTLEIQIQNSTKKIMQAQSQLELLEKNVDLAQKKYDMTQTAYSHGSKDFLTLQDSANSLLNAKISLMSQKITLLNAVLSLENTLGIPFGTLMDSESK